MADMICQDGFCNVTLSTGQNISILCHVNNNQWTIIQRRLDGSVNFKRNWTEYKTGFGSLYSEFWIGNSNLFHLTSNGYTHLRIELMDHNCQWRYAEYGLFYIQGEANNYRMHVSSYSGNAGDSFSYHDNMDFSTFDKDNDKNPVYNCALGRFGGWWYNSCHRANLNGQYGNVNKSDGINWYAWRGFEYSMTEVRMMLRKP
uniref:Ficolin-2-like n=1 Tax=Crassostrea virginica TaxID=6565 RepID=A0A8B8BYQ7_CRAVI|nr:ficolin-2-like [Crassostrea virginica]